MVKHFIKDSYTKQVLFQKVAHDHEGNLFHYEWLADIPLTGQGVPVNEKTQISILYIDLPVLMLYVTDNLKLLKSADMLELWSGHGFIVIKHSQIINIWLLCTLIC